MGIQLAKQYGIASHWLTQPIAIHGEGSVDSVECLRMELGLPLSGGREVVDAVADGKRAAHGIVNWRASVTAWFIPSA